MNQKPQLTKPIKISNVGAFDDSGIQINFGAKQNSHLANVNFIVGKNGTGKSAILKTLFFGSYNDKRSLLTTNNQNSFEGLNPDDSEYNKLSDWQNVFYYTPNTFVSHNKGSNFSANINRDSRGNEAPNWVSGYDEHEFINYISNIEYMRDRVDLYELRISKGGVQKMTEEDYIESKNKVKITSYIETLVKKIYEINFEFRLKSGNYKPYFNDHFFEFSELSTGYRQIISLITDILIKVWSIESDLEDKSQGQFVLLLDEVEQSLHPEAQSKILPALQSMFPNSEIFCTTHSPFVVNSVDDAWVYELSEENYKNKKGELWQEGDGTKFLDGTKTNPFDGYENILINQFNYKNANLDKTGGELGKELFKLIRTGKASNRLKELVGLVRESSNQFLISKLEMLLSEYGIKF